MPRIRKIRLQDILKRAWRARRQLQLAVRSKIMQRAAMRALSHWDEPWCITVDGFNFFDDCTRGSGLYPSAEQEAAFEKAMKVRHAAKQQVRRMARGEQSVYFPSWNGPEVDLSFLDLPGFALLKEHYEMEQTFGKRKHFRNLGRSDLDQMHMWNFILVKIRENLTVTGVTDSDLESYADILLRENLGQTGSVSAEIARLNDIGFGEELLTMLWERYPEHAKAIGLPEAGVTDEGDSQEGTEVEANLPAGPPAAEPPSEEYVLVSELWKDDQKLVPLEFVSPDRVVHGDREEQTQRIPRLLLRFMTSRRSAEESELTAIWGDVPKQTQLKSAVYRANEVLAKLKCAHSLSRKDGQLFWNSFK